MTPEFPLPQLFRGAPVVAGIYVPRAGRYVPLWVVVAADDSGVFHVALLREDDDSIDSWYDLPSRDRALDLMREKADFWLAARQ